MPKIKKLKEGPQKDGSFIANGIEINPRIIRTCHDADCPQCRFPETIIVREQKTMKPLWEECSKRDCEWGRKIFAIKSSKK